MALPDNRVTAQLARHVARFPAEAVPADVIACAKRSLLDALGVTLAASRLGDAAAPFVAMAREAQGAGRAPVVGMGFSAPASLAALANGALAHALDFEDTHDAAIVHPYAATIPAALSALAGRDTSGLEFLASIAHGANLVCRVSLAMQHNPEPDGWFLNPMLNVYGAAGAAARLMGATPEAMESAFSLAFAQATCSSNVKHTPGSEFRAVRDGFNAQGGYVAAALAAAGTVGFNGVFDPPHGFYELYSRGLVDLDQLAGDLETRWENRAISYKPWPSCRGTHAFVEAALDILARPGFSLDRVEQVTVRVSPFYATLCHPKEEKCAPKTAPEAKFSIPFVLATALLRGRVSLDDFDDAALARGDVPAFARRIAVDVDKSIGLRDAMGGGVTIRTADGATWRHDVTEPRGSTANPMSDAEFTAKFLACAERALVPPAGAARLAELVMGLDGEKSASVLLDALR